MGSKQKDLTGLTFGRLTVVCLEGSKRYGKSKKRIWRCICQCGNSTTVYTSALTSGNTKSCGCYHNSLSADNGRRSRDKVANKMAGFNAVKDSYKRNAKKRSLDFNLTDEELIELFSSPCEYCGEFDSNTYNGSYFTFRYNGIDRVDNTQGYFIDNCVSCCKICNHAKRDLTYEEFLEWILKAHNNLFRG